MLWRSVEKGGRAVTKNQFLISIERVAAAPQGGRREAEEELTVLKGGGE